MAPLQQDWIEWTALNPKYVSFSSSDQKVVPKTKEEERKARQVKKVVEVFFKRFSMARAMNKRKS